jgi:hypothetical protein
MGAGAALPPRRNRRTADGHRAGAFAAARLRPFGLGALAATGGLLMMHDWKDREVWFERGPGQQP